MVSFATQYLRDSLQYPQNCFQKCPRTISSPIRIQVKVGRYYLEQLIADLDSSKESGKSIRKRLNDPTALGDFLQLCHLRLLHERDVSMTSTLCLIAFTFNWYSFRHMSPCTHPYMEVFFCYLTVQRFTPSAYTTAPDDHRLRQNHRPSFIPRVLSQQASSLELVFDTMTCLFQHLGSRAVPMLPFLGSVLHMLTYSLPAILGPVGAAEELATDADEFGHTGVGEKEIGGAGAEPRSGAQATATYYAAVQVTKFKRFVIFGGFCRSQA